MIERKCLKCGTWNHDEKFCKSCNAALAPEEIIKEEEAAKQIQVAAIPKDRLDILIERARGSKYLLVRWAFYSIYTVALIVTGISSFFAYMVVWAVG